MAPLNLERQKTRAATREELERAHDPAYLDAISTAIGRIDADTVMSEDSWEAAQNAAGAGLVLGESWLAGEIDAGFACVRPPGHHAERGRAMGFCLLGNIAILALALHEAGKNVAIVDWDVHHGNGTEDILKGHDTIGFCSLHQSPLWPGTGHRSYDNILNLPMSPGSGDAEYEAVFHKTVLPWLDDRNPDVVLLSAGFDAHARDPLAQQEMTEEGFATLMSLLATRPVLAMLEGGYHLDALGASVLATVSVLAEAPAPRA